MRLHNAPSTDADDDAGLVPMADLLIGTTATLLLVVLVLAPQLGTVAGPPDVAPAIPAPAAAGAPVLFAADQGLTGFGDAEGVDLGLDDIAALSLDPSHPPLLVIGHGGQEAAFLTEARLSALSFATVRRVRLPAECSRIVAISQQDIVCE